MHAYLFFQVVSFFFLIFEQPAEDKWSRSQHSGHLITRVTKGGEKKISAKIERRIFLAPPTPLPLPFFFPPFFLLSLSQSQNYSTSYPQKTSVSQRIDVIWLLISACAPSGWQEEFLPHNRSEISKMLSVKLNY